MRRTVSILFILLLLSSGAHAQSGFYEFYLDELSRNADGPAVSRSVWAGRLAPASWRAIDRVGWYVDWGRNEAAGFSEDFSTVIGLKYLGFSARHFAAHGQEATDYTFGLSMGNRSASLGLGYGWHNGSGVVLGNTDRLQLSAMWRTRWTSIAWMNAYDVNRYENVDHFSLGLRPVGPRLTFFGEYLGQRESAGVFNYDGWDRENWGYGVNAELWPGVSVGFRGDDDGGFGARLVLGGDGMRSGGTYRADDDGDHRSTTWSVEFTRGPRLRDAMPGLEHYAEIDLRGSMTYRRYGWFDSRPRFLAVLAHINALSESETVDGVVINMSGLRASPAMLWELRAQLAGLRERGKTVCIYLDRTNAMGYAFATVADEIWIDPMGEIELKGINFGRSYYANALAKVGVGFDEWRFFKYKSAVESFSRTGFSEGAREQLTEVMNEFWDSVTGIIREARGLEDAELMEIVNEKGMALPAEAEELGLVDAIGTYHDLVANAPMVKLRADRGGQVARLGPMLGDHIWRQEEWSELPRIAVLYAIGPCDMDSGINGRRLSRMIRAVRSNPRVKAVVLRVDSPGGDPLPSDLVARELRETAEIKPVIVSQGQVAGSGGYWISMRGDRILASPLTITGSIGVISGHVFDDGISSKLGVDYDHVQIGDHADIGSGPGLPGGVIRIAHRPVTAEERARAEHVIMDLYDQFVNGVAESRGMDPEAVEAVAQGRIYSGTGGVRHGLVDEIGGLWDAIVLAKEAAGLDPGASISILEGPDLGRLPAELLQPSWIGLSGSDDPLRRSGGVVGEDAEASVALVDRPGFFAPIFTVEQWAAMSIAERAWVTQLFRTPRRPIAMMEPVGLDWDLR